MIGMHETFSGTYPFAPHFLDRPEGRLHYVDEGKGDVILCLHGEPTWSYLYREIIAPLARTHRVIAPDYLGFGKSDKRSSRIYTAAKHVDDIEALILDLNLKNITAVLHDWGGPIGGGVIVRHPQRFRSLVLMNTVLPLGLPIEAELLRRNGAESEWFGWGARALADDSFEAVLRNAGVAIVGLMNRIQGFERSVNSEFFRAYSLPFATPEECDGVIAFPRSILRGEDAPPSLMPAQIRAVQRLPARLLYGMRDRALLPQYMIPIFEAAFPKAPVVRYAQAGHFIQEDIPGEIVEQVQQSLVYE